MITFQVNWLAIIVAAVANMVIGFVYYHPRVLGGRWIALMGRRMDEIGQAGPAYAGTAIAALVAAFVVALFVKATGAATLTDGVIVGVLGWLGFTATATVADYLFSGRPWELWGIQNAYQLICFAVAGGILGAWR